MAVYAVIVQTIKSIQCYLAEKNVLKTIEVQQKCISTHQFTNIVA